MFTCHQHAPQGGISLEAVNQNKKKTSLKTAAKEKKFGNFENKRYAAHREK
jgi:hypothetical protein